MIDEEAFLDSLVPIFLPKLARGIEKYSLIQAPFNHDSPSTAYATLQVLNEVTVGQAWEGPVTSLGQQMRQDVDITVRINTYGKGAITTAKNFQSTLEYPSMVDKMNVVNVVWRSHTPVVDLTPLIKTAYQERATFDVVLGTSCDSYDEDVVPVEKVNVEISTTPSEDPLDAETNNTFLADPNIDICGQ
jgi:hypothetical protein